MNNTITPTYSNSLLVTDKLSNDLTEKKNKITRRQGLIGKGFDSAKSAIGVGKNSKKATQMIQDYKAGKVDYNTVNKYLDDFQYTQRDATELVLDSATGLGAFGAYAMAKKGAKFASPFLTGVKLKFDVAKVAGPIGTAAAILTGISIKPTLRFIDRIYLNKNEKKDNKTFWKDNLTGAIDGALAPVAVLKGAILGIPLVMGENALQRYMFVKTDDKKSTKDFLEKQKDNLAVKAVATGAVAYKARKLHTSLGNWDKAIENALKNVKDLKPFEKVSIDSDFNMLQSKAQLLLNDPKFVMDIFSSGKSIEEKMQLIEAKNIFLPKFIQTIPENILGMLGKEEINFGGFKLNTKEISTIITRFKSDCPQSRTIEEAQDFISKTYGDKYTIINDKALGVGTVAETFLAKDNTTGKEVVIKLLKKGMSSEKIENDRKAFIDLVKQNSTDDKEKTDFTVRKINSLFDAWSKEVDLSKEMEATQILGKNARNYHAVKPIEVKDNIYVMEKAPGIQFNEFIDQMLKENKTISSREAMNLMRNYFQVFFEQLLSVPPKGQKVMHADPHPGNIFINLADKEKPFTFIDTGNVLRYTPEEAIDNALNHLDYFIGNSKGIAKSLLRDANLPEGMTEKQALELVTKGLNEKVYNGHTNLVTGGNFFKDVNDVALKIMSDNGIIANQNNTNLLKAETTYFMNLTCLKDIQKIMDKNSDISAISEEDAKKQMELILKEIGESIKNSAINNKRYTTKKLKDRMDFISENKEQFYSTILSFAERIKP